MIYVKNVAQVQAQLKAWMEKQRRMAETTARGLAISAFEELLRRSPQFSGDFAANWNLAVNRMDLSFEPFEGFFLGHGKGGTNEPFALGDLPAQDEAKRRNAGKLANFRLGDTVYITNVSAHNQAYAVKIEQGTINFRDVNRLGAHPMANTLATLGRQWKVVSSRSAKQLAKKEL